MNIIGYGTLLIRKRNKEKLYPYIITNTSTIELLTIMLVDTMCELFV